MKSPMLLWRELAAECGELCRVSTSRDFETVSRRSKAEGLSFLTITLADYGKDFDEALAAGFVALNHFAGFRRWKGLPRFLGGFLELIFDRECGVLLDEPDVNAVVAIRQLTRLFSKVELPCTYVREREAFDQYIKTDLELAEVEENFTDESDERFVRVSRLLFGGVLGHVDTVHGIGGLIPKHGPGSTADRLLGNEKFDLNEWTHRLEWGGFHSVDYLLPSPRFWLNLDRVQFASPGDERPVRVISVPKTLKTPRIIAVEPTCMQYTQQAVAECLVGALESDPNCRDFVGFTDQEPNQLLARRGSRDGSLATLDLSEASDRVSNHLVRLLCKGYTHLNDAVQACRSLRADVPGHGIHSLTKFASMGSALTFPMEAMVFLTVVFMGIEEVDGHRLTFKRIQALKGRVRIYGDDIIVPVEYATAVTRYLELYGFKVNVHKSFWNGNFRESCGKEYFNGYDVSIVKCRRIAPSSLRDVQEIVSWVSFRNQLYAAGYRSTVEKIDSYLKKILQGYFPRVGADSPVLGRVNGDGEYDVHSTHARTHQPLAKGWIVSARSPESPLDGEGALLKWFLKRSELPFADKDHLERSGRPRAVSIKLSKAPVL